MNVPCNACVMLGKMQPPVLILCPPPASLGLFLHPSRGKPGPLLVYPGGTHFLSSPLSLSFLPRSSPTSSRSSLGRGRGLRFSKHGLTPSPGTRPALLDYKSSAELDTTPAKVTLTALIKLSPEEKLGLGRNNIGPRFQLFRRDPSRKYVRSRGA